MTQLYDAIGIGYERYRRPDPRIAAAVIRALGEAETVVNVGAGTGSYEPVDRSVVAVEPSLTMIRQRRAGGTPVVQASATHLPFRDGVFAAAKDRIAITPTTPGTSIPLVASSAPTKPLKLVTSKPYPS